MPYCSSSQAVSRATLEPGPRFIHEHVDTLPLFVGHSDGTQRGTPIHCRQRSGVAVVNDRVTVVDQRRAVLRHALD